MKHIKTIDDFKNIKSTDSCILDNDIDFRGEEINYLLDDYRGVFDGNSYTLKNIVISPSIFRDEQPVSLIISTFKATIKNLNIDNLQFKVNYNGYSPNISALCDTCEYSILENINIKTKDDISLFNIENKNTYSNIKINNKIYN